MLAYFAIALPIGLVLWHWGDSEHKVINYVGEHPLGTFWTVFTVLMVLVVVFGSHGLLSGNMR